MCVVKTVEVENVKLTIFYDDSPENPRKFSEPLGTILYSHGRYNVGDRTFDTDLYNGWIEARRGECGKDDEIIYLPVYLYDHSVVVLSTESFIGRALHAEWDSGQVGWIYVTKERVRKEYGVKRITKEIRERVLSVLKAEIEEFSEYIEGNVFGFSLEDTFKDEEIDSCCGFYGWDELKSGLKDYLAEEYHPLIEKLD